MCHVVLPSHFAVKGSDFWHSSVRLRTRPGISPSQTLHGNASGFDGGCLLSFFFLRSCPSPHEGCTRGHNNPLLCVPAVSFDAVYLHQSLTQMMNRRQLLSLVVGRQRGNGDLMYRFKAQHNVSESFVFFTLFMNLYTYFKGTLHRSYTSRSAAVQPQ